MSSAPLAGAKRDRASTSSAFDAETPFFLLRLTAKRAEIFCRQVRSFGGACTSLSTKHADAAAVLESSPFGSYLVVGDDRTFAKVAADAGLTPEKLASLVSLQDLRIVREGWVQACLEQLQSGRSELVAVSDAWRVSASPGIAASLHAPPAPTSTIPRQATMMGFFAKGGAEKGASEAGLPHAITAASSAAASGASSEAPGHAALHPDAPWLSFPHHSRCEPGASPSTTVPPPVFSLPPELPDAVSPLPQLVSHMSFATSVWTSTTGEAAPALPSASAGSTATSASEVPHAETARLLKTPMVEVSDKRALVQADWGLVAAMP